MSRLFTVGEESTHRLGEPDCPECWEEYPAPCPCGGLMHAGAGEEDPDNVEWPTTQCDRCGRSEEEIE
jgi:hypothetical protein